MALVTQRLVHRLRQSSQRDALTGVLNRGAIQDALANEGRRARQSTSGLALLLLDADRFKSINDRLGHAAGDRALQHLATVLADQMRDSDRIGRWGGEEFLVLLPGLSLAEACTLADGIVQRVAALPVRWKDAALPLTVSIGVTAWRPDDQDEHALVERADQALYRAKLDGRNCARSL